MSELELRRIAGDRFTYELPGIGTLRLGKSAFGKPVIEAGGITWVLKDRLLRRTLVATKEATGAVDLELRRHGGTYPGGTFTLDGRDFAWERGRGWDDNWWLKEGERELVHYEPKREPSPRLLVTVVDGAQPPPLALLLGCYLSLQNSGDADVWVPTA